MPERGPFDGVPNILEEPDGRIRIRFGDQEKEENAEDAITRYEEAKARAPWSWKELRGASVVMTLGMAKDAWLIWRRGPHGHTLLSRARTILRDRQDDQAFRLAAMLLVAEEQACAGVSEPGDLAGALAEMLPRNEQQVRRVMEGNDA